MKYVKGSVIVDALLGLMIIMLIINILGAFIQTYYKNWEYFNGQEAEVLQ